MRYVCWSVKIWCLFFALTFVQTTAFAHDERNCHDPHHNHGKHLHLGWWKHKLCKHKDKHHHGKKWKEFCREPAEEVPPPVCHPAENYSETFEAYENSHFPFGNKCGRKDFRNYHNSRWPIWNNGIYY